MPGVSAGESRYSQLGVGPKCELNLPKTVVQPPRSGRPNIFVTKRSALGQKQTGAPQQVMSALPPEADIDWPLRDARFVPIADMPLMLSRVCKIKTPAD
jgi:hypothetical protein